MKKLCLLIMAALLCFAFPLAAGADEEARYNFASAQGPKDLAIVPGEEGKGEIYFYNVDGNRITHINLEVSEAPSGWEVTVEPGRTETKVMVSGMPVTVVENLYVEPSGLLAGEPQNVPADMVSIKVPGRGYALGKLARVAVGVPESESPGATGEIVIAAEASWLGQSGAAAVKQERDFIFTVTVASGITGYTETVVEQDGPAESPEAAGEPEEEPDGGGITAGTEALPPGETAVAGGESSGSSVERWLPVIIAGAVVIVGAVVVILFVRRRR